MEAKELRSLTADVLESVGTVFSLDENFWTTGCLARDSYGSSIHPDAHQACRWCAMGAIDVAIIDSIQNEIRHTIRYIVYRQFVDFLSKKFGTGTTIHYWNDFICQNQEEVVEIFFQVAEELRNKGA